MQRFASLLALLVLLPLAGQAQFELPFGETPTKPNITAQLITDAPRVEAGQSFTVGVRLEMADTWHTYWINYGDAGMATTVEWDLPEGFTAGPIQWPAPMRFESAGIYGFGYEHHVTHLVEITPPAALPEGTDTVELKAEVEWLGCDPETCVPGDASVSITLPTTSDRETPIVHAQWMQAARKRLPVPADSVDAFTVSAVGGTAGVTIRVEGWPRGESVPFFFPYDPELNSAIYTKGWNVFEDGTIELPVPTPTQPGPLGVLDFGQGHPVVEVPAASDAPPTPLAFAVLLKWIGFGFLGGIILNLMPCVFPVLSLKVLGFVQQAQHGKGTALTHSLVFTAGILLSFWAIVALLLGLKASGVDAGWGVQLSNPSFVMAMAFLMFAIGLNLAGIFEVGTSLTGVGGELTQKGGMSGSFFSGLLATLLATPCMAPGMAGAIAVALAQSGWVTFSIFTAIALGMAAPYILLSANQKLLDRMPRPGPWMETFKQFLAFPMFGTVIWLVWTFTGIAGEARATRLLWALLILAMAGWAYGRWGSNPARTKPIQWRGRIAALFLFVGAVAMGGSKPAEPTGWSPFSPEEVKEQLAAGKPVFVDFTARWCITCQANKKAVLRQGDIEQAFADAGVTTLVADYTSQPPELSRFIRSLGREGVPVYALYDPANGPDAPPTLLPNTLTKGAVQAALQKLAPPENAP